MYVEGQSGKLDMLQRERDHINQLANAATWGLENLLKDPDDCLDQHLHDRLEDMRVLTAKILKITWKD